MLVHETGKEQKQLNLYFTENASYWDRIYESEDITAIIFQERFFRMLELVDRVQLPAGSSALDIGCGAGAAAIAVAKRGYSVQAMDPVPEMVDHTLDRAARMSLRGRVRVSLGDVRALPFKSRAFELVFALGVLPWMRSKEQALLEMVRVLKPGGYLITTMNNRRGFPRFMDPLTNPLLAPVKELTREILGMARPPGEFLMSMQELDRRLKNLGLKKISGTTFGFGPFTLFRREIFRKDFALKLHSTFQRLADRHFPLVWSMGHQYLTLLQK